MGGGTRTKMIRIHLDTHRELRHVKHEMEKESFDAAIKSLIAHYQARKQPEPDLR